MLVLKLCQQFCPDKIPVVPTTKLGDGADGEVFDIEGQPDRVIKFCIVYEEQVAPESITDEYKRTQSVIDWLQGHPVDICATIYSSGYMGEFSRKVWGNKEEKYILYYYIMEKMQKISEDERRVFHSILSNEDRRIVKNFTTEQVKKMVAGLSRGLDFDVEKVIFFCDNLKRAPIIHLDMNPRNIMKDPAGNFRLIDFDRAEIRS
jgi:serine/threonine protein kinase